MFPQCHWKGYLLLAHYEDTFNRRPRESVKVENLCLRLYYRIGGNVTKGIEFSACCLNCLSVVTLGLCSVGFYAACTRPERRRPPTWPISHCVASYFAKCRNDCWFLNWNASKLLLHPWWAAGEASPWQPACRMGGCMPVHFSSTRVWPWCFKVHSLAMLKVMLVLKRRGPVSIAVEIRSTGVARLLFWKHFSLYILPFHQCNSPESRKQLLTQLHSEALEIMWSLIVIVTSNGVSEHSAPSANPTDIVSVPLNFSHQLLCLLFTWMFLTRLLHSCWLCDWAFSVLFWGFFVRGVVT